MHHDALARGFELTVLASTLSALGAGLWTARAASTERAVQRPAPRARAVFAAQPLVQLALVCALLVLNQILCHAHVLRAHGGDASFVTRYLGRGWFALATGEPVVRFVAAHVGDGLWLSPTVLRVQAFLELPFTLFAYLAVARILGRAAYRACLSWPILVFASLSFTVTFSLVELGVPNPWTADDVALRFVAFALVTPYVGLVGRLSARDDGALAERPTGVLGLLSFFAGAGAVSVIVLAVYDALLLYNLAHLRAHASALGVAGLVAAASTWGTPRVDAVAARLGFHGPSPAIDAIVTSLETFTVVFFVPSLVLRYWGTQASAVLSGIALVVGSALAGLTCAARRAREPAAVARLVVGAVAALAAGALATASAYEAPARSFGAPELALAKVALALLAAATLAYRVTEMLLGGVCWRAHEAQTQADEA